MQGALQHVASMVCVRHGAVPESMLPPRAWGVFEKIVVGATADMWFVVSHMGAAEADSYEQYIRSYAFKQDARVLGFLVVFRAAGVAFSTTHGDQAWHVADMTDLVYAVFAVVAAFCRLEQPPPHKQRERLCDIDAALVFALNP